MTRVLIASPLGVLIGLALGSLGSGGSILAVPVLVYAAGQTPQNATASSLLLVGTAALFGLRNHLRAGRVRLLLGTVFGLTGIGGSVAGTALNRQLDPRVLMMAFSGLILVAAWRMMTACPSCTQIGEGRALASPGSAPPGTAVAQISALLLVGTLVGFLTGLFGVGGGFVVVPALTLALGLNMPQAIGTSLLVVAINSAVALIVRLETAQVDWTVALPFTIAAVIGAQLGAQIADRAQPERSLRAFAVGLVALALFTGARSIVALTSGE